jgi:hypothetical protein
MLVYEDCRHEQSAPQVRAMERTFKKSSEGQRLNKLIHEKNVDGFLPRSVGEYMNAAEDLASEAEAALRKARKYTDAAGGKTSASGAGAKRRQQAFSSKPKCPVAAFLIMSTRIVFIGLTLILIRTLRLSMRNPPWGFDITIRLGDGISKNVTWIQLCPKTIEVRACNESGHGWTILLGFRANLLAASGQYRAAEIPPNTVAAIPRSKLTLPCMSRHINAIVGSVSQVRTLAVESFTISVEKQ